MTSMQVHFLLQYKTENRTTLVSKLADGCGNGNKSTSGRYDYKFYTPWRFGGSLGYTVGQHLALGATYEYADYSYSDIRVNEGGVYDYWGNYYEESSRDQAMKGNIKNVLKGVSTVKVGAEYKPMPNLAVRLGYNYVSPMYNKNGYKDGTLNSYSTYYSSSTDYTNWNATNRVTAGVGYTYKKFSIDLAYQYSRTTGEFFPFMSYSDLDAVNGDQNKYDSGYDNFCDGQKVSNKHHQLILTLGYRF
jgi:opacity protein-like surface antigen